MKSKSNNRRRRQKWLGASVPGALAALAVSAAETSPGPPGSAAATNPNLPAIANSTNAAPAAAASASAEPTTGAKAPSSVAGTNAPSSTANANAPAAGPEPWTPEQFFEGGTNVYSNWIDWGVGGFWTSGNKAQAQAAHRAARGVFGGIEDFRYQTAIDKSTLTIDGRALFDQNDYRLSLDYRQDDFGYLRFSYDEFRTWSNGDGGYDRPTGQYYAHSGDALALDRGTFVLEGGLTLKDRPQITFKYVHAFRDGDKSSTIWGITHPDFNRTQGLSPTVNRIDERSDTFQIDVAKTIKATDLGGGIRYESGRVDNSLRITQSPGEPGQQRITDQQNTSYDLFNAHVFSETRLQKNLVFSSAYAYSGLDNQLSGSRIYGATFDAGYTPAAANGNGFYALNGSSHLDDHVINLNLAYRPTETISVVPSVRFSGQTLQAQSSGLQTLAANPVVPFSARSDGSRLDIRERVDGNYTGLTNTTLYARGEWTQGLGDLDENGGQGLISGIGVPIVRRQTDDTRLFQKYSAGIRWYPTPRATIDVGGDYKLHHYDYDHSVDSTPNDPASINRYPAYLVTQDLESYGGKTRLTIRPRQNVTLVSHYEYQLSTIRTKPDGSSGLGEVESSTMHSHIFGEDISWTPWSRLNLQAGLNFVCSTLETPASRFTRSVLDSQNNYWSVNFGSTFVIDDKTDLNLGYLYYRADDFKDNSAFGVPYGVGDEEHSITAGLVRRIRQNLRLYLRYGYFQSTDETSGGHQDYHAHMVSCVARYLF